jgi:polyribonucleotide nucleotidyltransferase
MGSVCGSTLALMDAGVPISAPVSGIAMGLIKEGDDVAILTDIMGMEDHLGDMDFKVAGTREGITALQMDIKIQEGLSLDIMTRALAQAREARLFILDRMAEALPESRPELSPRAPRIEIVKIDPQRIGELIGPSGKNIRGICEATGAQIDIQDDGSVFIAAADGEVMRRAREMVLACTASAEIGKIYTGKVVRITDFGCFVEILPKKDGLVHVSELDFTRVDKVTDICREGDMMKVKCIDIDPMGKVRLSRKAALADEPGFIPPPGYKPDEPGAPRPHSGGGDRGGRPHSGPPRHGGSSDRGGSDRGGSRGGPSSGGVDRGGRHHDS